MFQTLLVVYLSVFLQLRKQKMTVLNNVFKVYFSLLTNENVKQNYLYTVIIRQEEP